MEIEEVEGELDDFIGLSKEVYRSDPLWCGESREYLEKMIAYSVSVGSCPKLFMVRDGNVVARASGSKDPRNDTGFIGHFEALKDQEKAVSGLFSRVEEYLKGLGVKRITAPRSDIMTLGLQISGFELPQTWRTPRNPPYYRKYFEANGYEKKEDLLTYIMDQDTPMEIFGDIEGVRIRSFNREDLENEMALFNRLNNAIFSSHENFIPRSLEEDTLIIGSMLPYLDDDLVLIAERNEEPVGMLISVPDHNQRLKEGKIERARLISIGVVKEHSRQGIGKMLGKVLKKNMLEKGYVELEGSWVLESNIAPQMGADLIGASMGRLFRVYTKDI